MYFLLGLYFSKLCHPITFRENILIKTRFDESAVKALLHFYAGKHIHLPEYFMWTERVDFFEFLFLSIFGCEEAALEVTLSVCDQVKIILFPLNV